MKFFAKGLLLHTLLLFVLSLSAQQPVTKEVLYLSGTDVLHTKTWDFKVSDGRKSGNWSTIQVPSHWEQQGYGTYNYGRDNVTFGKNFQYAKEKGLYQCQFKVPAAWKNKAVYLVFEGSMTDTEVKINEKSAGATHQGSFYRFKYQVDDKLRFGDNNLLEVTVSKWSAEPTVNNAERLSDFWIFGGIFRPVYLEAVPKEHISWTSIDAKANGTFRMNVHLNKAMAGRSVQAEIIDQQGFVIAKANTATTAGDSVVMVQTAIKDPLLWTAETPTLYTVKTTLLQAGKAVYQTSDKFGFRTIEVRKQEGIFVNGTRIKVKGVNRHVFWPEYGRATYPEADLSDVQLIKSMNMNAVRCSHYPPDPYFLRVCDSLGLYVIDELAGWQKAYSTAAGRPLVKEMVIRDASHPSILFWSNGNEGGHNKELDGDFARYDLSARTVIHAHHKPGNAINGIDCNHYEDYYSTKSILADTNIYMPTEFLHAMHDGGGGAALADFWELHWASDKGAGGFIWNLADEGIMRTDRNNMLDIDGLNAPDGVVGPHREKEGSYYAIKEIYSPVRITMKELPADFNGQILVENRYNFTNLKQCTFKWLLTNAADSNTAGKKYLIIAAGDVVPPDIAPTNKGTLTIPLPADWRNSDLLRLTAIDPAGRELYRWVWKVKSNRALTQHLLDRGEHTNVSLTENDSIVTVKANGISVGFNKRTGLLSALANDNSAKLSFNNGPVLVAGNASFTGLKHYQEDSCYVIESAYTGDLHYVRWKMHPNGWLEMKYEYALEGSYKFAGISFSYPEALVLSAKWLGNGPGRVWKNRLQGVVPGVYENYNNNTNTGNFPWIYPEFKGYYSEMVWMELSTMEGKFTIFSPDDHLFVRLFEFYAIRAAKLHPELPVGDISFLDAIPPVGSKMGLSDKEVRALGSSSELNVLTGNHTRTLYFFFGLMD